MVIAVISVCYHHHKISVVFVLLEEVSRPIIKRVKMVGIVGHTWVSQLYLKTVIIWPMKVPRTLQKLSIRKKSIGLETKPRKLLKNILGSTITL